MFLVAIIDWFSRFVLAWELSTTLDTSFCLEALDRSLQAARPEIFNTDQGAQFTSRDFTDRLLQMRCDPSGTFEEATADLLCVAGQGAFAGSGLSYPTVLVMEDAETKNKDSRKA